MNAEKSLGILPGIEEVLTEDPDLRFDHPLRLDRSLEIWTSTDKDFNQTPFLYHHLGNPGLGASSLGEKDDFRVVEAGISLTTQQRIAEAFGSLDQRDGEVRMLTVPRLHLEALLVNEDFGSRLVVVIRGLRDLHEPLFGRELPAGAFFKFTREAPSLLGLGHGMVAESKRHILKLLE